MMTTRVDSVQEYFETLPQRFVQSASAGVEAIFQFEISGDAGGTWHVIVKDEALEINAGEHQSPSARILSSDDNYLKICNGDMNGLRAVMTRKMRIQGNLVLARKMQNMFPTGTI
jgi:putative sterol carrier protein